MTPVLATQILRDDHKRLKGLFRQLEAVDLRAHEMKHGVIREIFMEIEIHSAVEEQIFYPALLAVLSTPQNNRTGVDASLIDESIRDHREVDAVIQRMKMIPIDTIDFRNQLEELEELLEAHMEKEEQLTIPSAEALLGDELSPLGAQIQDLRDDLLRQPQYQYSRPEIVQNANGGEQMRTSTRTEANVTNKGTNVA
jgi:iron-sulfur cluster repair protein YtfE (RIC family)